MKAQMKAAGRSGARLALIVGEQELQDGPETVTGRVALTLFPELFLKSVVAPKK